MVTFTIPIHFVPPDTTVALVVVVVGAIVVVVFVAVGAIVVAVVVFVAGDLLLAGEVTAELDVELEAAALEVEVELECVPLSAAVVAAPGISVATSPPMTAAVMAAPPVAIQVIRRTFRIAAVGWPGLFDELRGGDMALSFPRR